MEEVPAHTARAQIRFDLEWGSRDVHFSGYKVKKEPLEAWILRAFTGSETDDDLILRVRGFIFLLIGRHILPDFSKNLVHIWTCSRIPALRPQLMTEIQADPLAPLGAIWCTSFDCSQLPLHTLVTYRDQLDFMPSDQVLFFMYLHFY
ncbi:hypothetical protein M9H77_35869 [Catharanthus roseus]|uniref:Uncharacterized protein n=1 Tax=Catharanthus roseus TaxID=4058 RepID=A0ACB9ZQ84_CATRO|nr:hypothetical protein M9H77_35869 [Catharanthus roseus]